MGKPGVPNGVANREPAIFDAYIGAKQRRKDTGSGGDIAAEKAQLRSPGQTCGKTAACANCVTVGINLARFTPLQPA